MKKVFVGVLSAVAVFAAVSCVSTEQAAPAAETAKTAAAEAKAKPQSIQDVSYDAASQALTLKFERGTYRFDAVPQDVFDAMSKSESKGSFYQKEIKGKYKATKVE